MPAFLALLEHVHSTLTTTYHNTPILLMASPSWARADYEAIARYIFEQTKTPALCMVMNSIATQYGIKWPSMCVIDIGYQKVDCTAIYEYQIVNHRSLGFPSTEQPTLSSGGDVFTKSLMNKLKSKNFNYEMAEQLKKSNICEVLPYAPSTPGLVDLPAEHAPLAQEAAAQPSNGPKIVEPARASGAEEENGENGEKGVDNDGVLDVASIVASGQTKEFLAKKEKEKEKAKSKKHSKDKEALDATAQSKAARLPNSRRVRSLFHYEKTVEEVVLVPVREPVKELTMVDAPASTEGTAYGEASSAHGEASSAHEEASSAHGDATSAHGESSSATGETDGIGDDKKPEASAKEPILVPERQVKKIRRDIEIGVERFTFAERAEIDRLTSLIYNTIQGVPEPYMRSQCWENIVFVGNGSRLRGLKENVMATLNARHLISPSTATIFLSELPSNIATPSGTGAQTPLGSFNTPPQLPTASSVNPLLQAATTASLQLPKGGTGGGGGDGSSNAGGEGHRSHHSHSQTPTNIRMAPLPTYLGEWNKNGYEEAMFLGSLIAARTAFCPAHNVDKDTLEHIRGMSLGRVDYKQVFFFFFFFLSWKFFFRLGEMTHIANTRGFFFFYQHLCQ